MALVLINPVCGDKSAPAFVARHVLPLLPQHSLHTTQSPADAPALVAQHTTPDVVLASGDGTLHDIISSVPPTHPVHFALVPCGTANALYSSLFPPPDQPDDEYKLQSVRAMIAHKTPLPLSLASTTLSAAAPPLISAVVVSTALHASILHDSEALRADHPGIERFKIAAQQNSRKWYNARLTLTPAQAQSAVQIYDPAADAFVPHPDAHPGASLTLDGPFVYFLSTVNVDRLEPAFRITPRARAQPAPSTCDIVVIRPLRQPALHADSSEARLAYTATTWAVLTAAYEDGAHVRLAYQPDNTGPPTPDMSGPLVVEYLRSGKWEWTPADDDDDAHLVCTDGAISTIPPHGSAVTTIDPFEHGFAVYV